MKDADEGDTIPSEWLSIADRPFSPPSEARRPVSIEWARHTGHAAHLYLLGYRRAAELLLPELITRSNEQLVFPFLFLWRHHIELYLKFLLKLAREHQGQTCKAPKVHTLLQLWNSLRPLLEPNMLDSDLEAVEQIVIDIHDVDPSSTEARYADGETPTGLIESLAKVPDGFNPEHFASVLTKVSDLFDGIQTEFKYRMDGRPESL
jgi:hypothetical protein